MMRERYANPADFNEARLRMARIPEGADLVANPVSKAPGFRIGNVIVMAGVPQIMQAMLDAVAPTLRTGAAMLTETISTGGLPEGDYGTALGAVQKENRGVSIGSYPRFDGARFDNQIVLRSRDLAALEAAKAAVAAMLAGMASAQG